MLLLPLLLVCLLIVSPLVAHAELNFPLPEFSQGYQLPGVTLPASRAQVFSYVDLAVLFVTLSLAAYLALRSRSRQHLVLLVVFAVLYFGFYRRGCVCSVGAIQNVALSLCNRQYALPFVVGGFFLLPLLFALVFGRVFCAAVCPLGAAQEVVLLRPVRVPDWLGNSLGLLPFFYLGAAVLYSATSSRFLICEADPFISFYRLGGPAWVVIFGAVVLLLSTVVGRPYCRFLCPYSVLLRLLAPFAKWQVRLTHGECTKCHLCANSCPFGAIRPPTPFDDGRNPRQERRERAALALLLLVLIVGGAWLGYQSSAMLSRVNPRVRLADRLWREQQGLVQGTTSESEAFYALGQPNEIVYRQAAQIRKQFDAGSPFFGAWLALVVSLQLISLSMVPSREGYDIDAAACVACGRCFSVCPVGRERAQSLAALEAKV